MRMSASPASKGQDATEIPGIAFCNFTEVDVVRHPLVQQIIKAYDRLDAQKKEAAKEAAANRAKQAPK